MIITETKTQQKLVEESNKLRRAYKDMSDKERKAFYNTVRGQVTKQRNALQKIYDGKVSKRYKLLSREKSPALEALETREEKKKKIKYSNSPWWKKKKKKRPQRL